MIVCIKNPDDGLYYFFLDDPAPSSTPTDNYLFAVPIGLNEEGYPPLRDMLALMDVSITIYGHECELTRSNLVAFFSLRLDMEIRARQPRTRRIMKASVLA